MAKIITLNTPLFFFNNIWTGSQTFHYQYNFVGKTGDTLFLIEFDQQIQEFTGRYIKASVGYALQKGTVVPVATGWSIISLLNIERKQTSNLTARIVDKAITEGKDIEILMK